MILHRTISKLDCDSVILVTLPSFSNILSLSYCCISMSEPVPIDAAGAQASTSLIWDRISNWVSENKAIAYTIAGTVVVVTGAGIVYYVTDSKKRQTPATPRKSKKERRKEKKEAEEIQKKPGIALDDREAGMSPCVTQASPYNT